MRSFLVVTIRSSKELDVGVTLVFSVTTFGILNISKIDRRFSVFVLNLEYPFKSLKSQSKSPDKTTFDVFNQAFTKEESIRSKTRLASAGRYITESNTGAPFWISSTAVGEIPWLQVE